LGPAAHSYLNATRFANQADLAGYCRALDAGRLPIDTCEKQERAMLAREMIFLGLRQCCGINEQEFLKLTGEVFCNPARAPLLQMLCAQGLINHTPPFWALSEQGLLVADGIAAKLF
jgi:oxygen-independent coproporphyrinogen-3 oxidase